MKPPPPKLKASLPPVEIVADGMRAHRDVANGRNVPVVIVNAANVPELREVIRSHAFFPFGDVTSDWGVGEKDSTKILLLLRFIRPVAAECVIVFQMPDRAFLVDQVLIAKGLYLQVGKSGDTISSTLDESRIFVDVASHSRFEARWAYLLPRIVARQIKKEQGVSSSEARRVAQELIAEWRGTIGHFRMPS